MRTKKNEWRYSNYPYKTIELYSFKDLAMF